MDLMAISNAIRLIDWSTLADIAVVITATFVIWQLREMQRTTQAQAYSVAVDRLQDEKVREARRLIFKLTGKPLEKWSGDEKAAAEVVCHTYDVVGQMVRHNLLSKKIILDSWGPSLRRSWPILEPLVKNYRQEFSANEFWDDYEWLATEAIRMDTARAQRTAQR